MMWLLWHFPGWIFTCMQNEHLTIHPLTLVSVTLRQLDHPINEFYLCFDLTNEYSAPAVDTNLLQHMARHPQPHVQLLMIAHVIPVTQSRRAIWCYLSRPAEDIHTKRLFLFISSQQLCRCFCRDANRLAHLSMQNERHAECTRRNDSFLNTSVLFQFATVNR